MSNSRSSHAGIDLRMALILFASLAVAIAAGVLTFIAGTHWALAVLSGGGSFAATCVFLDWLIASTTAQIPALTEKSPREYHITSDQQVSHVPGQEKRRG
ncbi:hypothetical protein ORV05_22550 [Amycolatopsis cynarae]|uniref:Uncharacterized protein n=1 Tax=Amycolatopsis cynarae TaxID=2995223 RepID=A0ABY7AXX3_9PSEU|nr:hypothetical protein [Amycolatopsis sp. HUAS 11-8]WAL63772.1 hypothetical protein ORV05_22550 [Amycolatopsis sp. HUAS 11-8]